MKYSTSCLLFLLLTLTGCGGEPAREQHQDHADEAHDQDGGGHDGGGHDGGGHDGGGHDGGGHDAEDHSAEHGTEEGHEGEDGLELAGLRGVVFATVEAERQESAFFAAEAISDPSAETLLSAPITGQVSRFLATPGQLLARGAAVLELRSPELADLEARFLVARARADLARREVAREGRLLERGATAARNVEIAQAEAEATAVEEQAARLALEARGVEPGSGQTTLMVRAPRAGILASFAVALGESVASGTRLGALVSPGAARVRLELALPGPETWKVGAETEVRRSDGQRWSAKVEGTPPQLAADTRRLTYFLRLEGSELPLAGTPLEVRVPLARAIVLPQTSLQQIEGTWGVFVRSGDHAGFVPVRRGPALGGDVLILEGVTANQEVATEGAYLLKALWLKRAGGGAGHDH